MRLFWQKGRRRRSAVQFKTSAILNARFPQSFSTLKIKGQAVTSEPGQQPIMEVVPLQRLILLDALHVYKISYLG